MRKGAERREGGSSGGLSPSSSLFSFLFLVYSWSFLSVCLSVHPTVV